MVYTMEFSYHFFSSGFSNFKLLPTVKSSKAGTVIPVSFPTLPFKPIEPNPKSPLIFSSLSPIIGNYSEKCSILTSTSYLSVETSDAAFKE